MDLAKAVSTKRAYQWNEGSLWQDEHAPGHPLAPAPARRRLRLWHQAQYPAPARRLRLPRDCRAGADARRRGSRSLRPMACFSPTARATRSRATTRSAPRRSCSRPMCRCLASALGIRFSASRAGARTREDEIRPSRRQSSGAGPRHRRACSSPARITASRSMRRRCRRTCARRTARCLTARCRVSPSRTARRSAFRDTRRRVPVRTICACSSSASIT